MNAQKFGELLNSLKADAQDTVTLYGTVATVLSATAMTVIPEGSTASVPCARCCAAGVGDRVIILVKQTEWLSVAVIGEATTFSNSVHITHNGDAPSSPGLIIGTDTSVQLKIDGNEILPYTSGSEHNLHLGTEDHRDAGKFIYANGWKVQAQLSGYAYVSCEAGETKTTSITFPKSFSSAPTVLLTPATTVPNKRGLGASGASSTGFTIYAYSETTVTLGVHWKAIERAYS